MLLFLLQYILLDNLYDKKALVVPPTSNSSQVKPRERLAVFRRRQAETTFKCDSRRLRSASIAHTRTKGNK